MITLIAGSFYSLSFYSIHKFWLAAESALAIHDNQFSIDTDNVVSFQKVSYEVSPYDLSVKVEGVSHKNKKSEVVYNSPIYLKFSPWSFDIQLLYKGTGQIISSLSAAKKNFYFDSDVKYEATTNLDIVRLKKLINKPSNIIHYFTNIDLVFNQLSIATDNTSPEAFEQSKLVSVKNTSYSLYADKMPDYTSFSNIDSNLPQSFEMRAKIDAQTYNKKGKIPTSIFYPIDYNGRIKGDVKIAVESASPKVSFSTLFENSNVEIICNACESDIADFTANINVNKMTRLVKTKMELLLKPHNNFAKNITPVILSQSKFIKNTLSFLSDDTFDNLAHEHFPNLESGSIYRAKCNYEYEMNGTDIDAKIREFSAFTQNNVGIGLKGTVSMKNLTPSGEFETLLFKPRELVNYWDEYYLNLFSSNENSAKIDPETLSFYNELHYDFLKAASEYPQSTSKDMAFRIKMDHKELSSSGKNTNQLKELYYQIKTLLIIKKLKGAKDPISFLNKVAPELKHILNDLLKMDTPNSSQESQGSESNSTSGHILEQKPNKIRKSLWQRLIQ